MSTNCFRDIYLSNQVYIRSAKLFQKKTFSSFKMNGNEIMLLSIPVLVVSSLVTVCYGHKWKYLDLWTGVFALCWYDHPEIYCLHRESRMQFRTLFSFIAIHFSNYRRVENIGIAFRVVTRLLLLRISLKMVFNTHTRHSKPHAIIYRKQLNIFRIRRLTLKKRQ